MAAKIDCRTARMLIRPYLDDELRPKACSEFLAHVQNCEECRRELENSFIVEYALQYLDDDKIDNFDIKELLDESIVQRERRMKRRQILTVLTWLSIIVMGAVIAGILVRLLLPEVFSYAVDVFHDISSSYNLN